MKKSKVKYLIKYNVTGKGAGFSERVMPAIEALADEQEVGREDIYEQISAATVGNDLEGEGGGGDRLEASTVAAVALGDIIRPSDDMIDAFSTVLGISIDELTRLAEADDAAEGETMLNQKPHLDEDEEHKSKNYVTKKDFLLVVDKLIDDTNNKFKTLTTKKEPSDFMKKLAGNTK